MLIKSPRSNEIPAYPFYTCFFKVAYTEYALV